MFKHPADTKADHTPNSFTTGKVNWKRLLPAASSLARDAPGSSLRVPSDPDLRKFAAIRAHSRLPFPPWLNPDFDHECSRILTGKRGRKVGGAIREIREIRGPKLLEVPAEAFLFEKSS